MDPLVSAAKDAASLEPLKPQTKSEPQVQKVTSDGRLLKYIKIEKIDGKIVFGRSLDQAHASSPKEIAVFIDQFAHDEQNLKTTKRYVEHLIAEPEKGIKEAKLVKKLPPDFQDAVAKIGLKLQSFVSRLENSTGLIDFLTTAKSDRTYLNEALGLINERQRNLPKAETSEAVPAELSKTQEDKPSSGAAARSVRFSDESEINIVHINSKKSETISIPTNPSDEFEIKPDYMGRKQEEMSVRKHVDAHYAKRNEPSPDNSALLSSVTFAKLEKEQDVDLGQFRDAAKNKMVEISKAVGVFGSAQKEGAETITKELDLLMQGMPNEKIKNQTNLKRALIENVKTNNEITASLDKQTFADLVSEGKKPLDLFNAPEFKKTLAAFRDGTWLDGEEREITFTKMDKELFNQFEDVIHLFFKDTEVQSRLQKFGLQNAKTVKFTDFDQEKNVESFKADPSEFQRIKNKQTENKQTEERLNVSKELKTNTPFRTALQSLNGLKAEKKAMMESDLGKQVVNLSNVSQQIINTSKNLMDVFNLQISPKQTPEDATNELIAAFEKAFGADNTMSTFNDKRVEDINRGPLLGLNQMFKSEIGKQALMDVYSSKLAAAENKIHISRPIAEAIANQGDIKTAAFLLLGEVCKMDGSIRRLDLRKCDILLEDPRIARSPNLKEAIIKEARDVQFEAIRKAQLNIIAEIRLDKTQRKRWESASYVAALQTSLDLEGMKRIAKNAGVTLPEINREMETFKKFEALLKEKEAFDVRYTTI